MNKTRHLNLLCEMLLHQFSIHKTIYSANGKAQRFDDTIDKTGTKLRKRCRRIQVPLGGKDEKERARN